MTKNIYIPIEIKARELSSHLYLAAHAASQDFQSVIGSKTSIYNLVVNKKSREGAYLTKGFMYPHRLKPIRDKCEFIGILDPEIGPASLDVPRALRRRVLTESIDLIDAYFVSSEEIKEYVKSFSLNLYKKTIVTGWPKVQMWQSGMEIPIMLLKLILYLDSALMFSSLQTLVMVILIPSRVYSYNP